MCSLCGVPGAEGYWSDAVARPGVFSRNRDARERRLERARPIEAANAIFGAYHLTLSDWQGRADLLATATSKTEVIETLAHLWPAEAIHQSFGIFVLRDSGSVYETSGG